MKRKYSPLPGAGASPGLPGQKTELGPELNPEGNLPTLNDTVFGPPTPKPGQNNQPKQVNARKPAQSLPGQDPFADELDNPINQPRPTGKTLNVLPGTPVDIVPRNENPFIPVKPDA
jgi:hypothetical protein